MDQQTEKRIRFVARRYKEGALSPEAAWNTFALRYGIRRRKTLRRALWGAAAVMLLLIGLSGRYWMQKNTPEWVLIATEQKEQKEIWMPDSTVITLAGNSSLRYDKKEYGKERRAVELKGKAFFEVRTDQARPFSVHTQLAKVEVLGTSFQIEEDHEMTRLHVQTGRVGFSAADDYSVLTAGMSAIYCEEKGMVVEEQEENINYLAWKNRRLRFKNTPLEQVIRDLNAAYQVEIVTPSSVDTRLRLTSYFDNQPLDEVLSIINQTLDIQLQKDSNMARR